MDKIIDRFVLKNGRTTDFFDVDEAIRSGIVTGAVTSSQAIKMVVRKKLERDLLDSQRILAEDAQGNREILAAIDHFFSDPDYRKKITQEIADLCWNDWQEQGAHAAPLSTNVRRAAPM